ncbi:hypothetical protein JW964_11750 [candidate division KSB1 bacterium]|nr:hypothetical protein [candidate division KSB1 bacterium]
MRAGSGLTIFLLLFLNRFCFSQSFPEVPKFTINLQAEAIIPGPYILLGEVSQISLSDSSLARKLSSVILTKAAVPGEAKEITISFIKKRIREIGLELSQISFKGPRVIRIKTLENNILNFFIDQYLAFSNYSITMANSPVSFAFFSSFKENNNHILLSNRTRI